jgi:twitching motility protein PilT
VIAEGGYYGMQTFDQHLLQHLHAGRITMDAAMRVATSPHDFKLMVQATAKPADDGPEATVETPAAPANEAASYESPPAPEPAPMTVGLGDADPSAPPPSAPPPGVRF